MVDAGAKRPRTRKELSRELGVVYAVQLALIAAFVRVDEALSLSGNLHALVAGVFIVLPVLALDRTDRAYRRYGIAWGRPAGDIAYAAALCLLLFPPIALFAPAVWGISEPGCAAALSDAFGGLFGALGEFLGKVACYPDWEFNLPAGYPGGALTHLVVVALPEEFFYRGYVMGRLDDIFKGRVRLFGAQVGWSLLIQAALFALGHYLVDFRPGRLAVFFPALAFGWLRAKRGTIGAGVAFHGASNIFMDTFRAGLGL